MKNLNRTGSAFSKATRNSHQFIQTHLSFHLDAGWLANCAKDCRRLAAVPFRDAHADLWIVDELRVGGGNVFLHIFVRAAFGFDRCFQKRQRAEIAVAVNLHGAAQIRLAKHSDVDHVARAEQVRL